MIDTSGRPVVVKDPAANLGRQATGWLVAMFVGIVLSAIVGLVQLPYAILQPGPVTNTLGKTAGGKPLITVADRTTYPTKGALDFTTVAVLGGPKNPVNGWRWIRARLDGTNAIVAEEEVFPKGVSSSEVDQESAAEMAESQQEAIAVALRALGQTVPEVVSIGEVTKDSPATGILRKGDVLVTIDGKAVTTPDSVRAAIRARKPGESVSFTVRRGGQEQVLTAKTVDVKGVSVVGVLLRNEFVFPTKVSINAGEVGGPSAGLMFALAVYDKLTPGALTGGATIAGTGTIDSAGTVGPIGGIQQKLVGAQRGKATWFLSPAGNCPDVVGSVPDGMRVVKVATFAQARDAVQAIAAKKTSSLPSCT